MNSTWELNLPTLISLLGAFVTLVAGWVTVRISANDAKAEARRANERIDTLNGAFSAYREVQAATMVSRDSLRDLKDELFERFDKLSDRVDRMLTGRGG